MEGQRTKEERKRDAGADWFARGAGMTLWVVVGVCCVAPLVWLLLEISSWDLWRNVQWDGFRWKLLGRTLLYNGAAAVVAVLMGLPAAVVVGRGRGVVAKTLMFLLPLGLVMPSVAYTYGWSHVFWLCGIKPVPASGLDVLRCVWTLAAWLWPLPALVIGMALRGLDSQVQQAAMLDGALWRVTRRLLVGPIVASLAMTMALAVQEFAVYERTGIVVISTEVRTVFESGIGSGDNPANVVGVAGGAGRGTDNQARRAGAALATSLPMIALAATLTGLALVILRRSNFAESLEAGDFPQCVEARWLPKLITAALWVLTVAVPVGAMVLSISPYRWQRDSLGHGMVMRVWGWASSDVLGSLFYGALAGGVTLVLAMLAAARLRPVLLLMALAAFLVGGEILAIADIRLFNRPGDFWQSIYNGPAIMVITCVGRFGWIGLVAGFATTGGAWRSLRDTAAVDGADTWQTMWRVVWPLAWPVLLGSAVLVMILTMTEVSAAVLVSPLWPTMLVPRLMGWVHMLRYDDMLEGTLLLTGLVAMLGAAAVGLIWLGRRMFGVHASACLCLVSLLLCGCRDKSKPEAIWLETGMAPGQLVYPRGIAYSPRDACFFVVDRSARIQRVEHDGKVSLWWRMPEWDAGKPVGLSVGPDGNVYVADTHYFRVMVFTPRGEFIRKWGSQGREPGQFIFPTDVAFDAAGNIYVSEYSENDRIQVFDPKTLAVLRTIGGTGQGDGQLSRPQSMLIDGNTLYVTDSCNHRIAVFTIDGKWLRNFGSAGGQPGQFRFPYGLDMDSAGRLVVCEFGNNRVQWIDRETGRSLKIWGSGGREAGQLAYPWAVAVDKRDRVVIVDSGNNRLQITKY